MKKHYISRGGLKSFIVFGIAFLSIISCRQQKFEEVVTPQDANPIGEVISADQALDQLYSFIDAMSPATRAEGRFSKVKSIREIKVSGGGLTTRGTICDVPDTLVYVVNFVDDEGFAVLGARRSGEPIYALTESGSFDADKLNAAIAEVQQRIIDGADAPTRASDNDEPMKEIGLDIIYPLMAEAMTAPTPRFAERVIRETIGSWSTTSSIGPLVEVKWDQRYPFNAAMRVASLSHTNFAPTTNFRGRYPAGCVMVAAAQIMSKVLMPNYIAGTSGKTYFWTPIVANVAIFSNAKNFHPTSYDLLCSVTEKLHTEQLADALRNLANVLDASYASTGTGASTASLVQHLKQINPIYYNNAKIANIPTNINSIKNCLNNGKPLYAAGKLSDNKSGHAWVIDGHASCVRTITQTLQLGYTGRIREVTKTEARNMWHCNWGYGGRNDGYFTEALFNMRNREFLDDTIDNNGIKDSIIGMDFSISLQAILY